MNELTFQSKAVDPMWLVAFYQGFLGREPSEAELHFHASTGLSAHEIAWNLFFSAEFDTIGRFPAALYLAIFDREPDYAGWVWQRDAVRRNAATQSQLISTFFASTESRRVRTQPNPVFVQMLWSRTLDRLPRRSTLDQYSDELLAGKPRDQLVLEILNSPEARRHLGPRLRLPLLFFALLGRDPTQDELHARAGALSSGVSLRHISDQLVDRMGLEEGIIQT